MMKVFWFGGGKKFAPKIQQELGAIGITVAPVEGISACLEALKADPESAVVVDLDLGRQGIEAIQAIHKTAADLPVIALVSLERLPVLEEALKHGVWDSFIKQLDFSHLHEFPRVLARCEEKKRLRAEAVRYREEAEKLRAETRRVRELAGSAQASPKRYEDETEWLGMVLQACAEGVFAADADSRLVFANAVLREVLGYGEEELIGKGIDAFVPSQQIDAASWTKVPLPYPQRRWRGNIDFKKKDGSSLPMTARFIQALDGKGAIKSTVGVCRVQTEIERAPTPEVGAASASSADQLLANIIDDLQSPLAAMLGYLQVASTITAEQAEPIQILAIKRLELMARRLMDLVSSHIWVMEMDTNRLEVHPSPLQIDQILEPAVETKRNEAGIKNIEILLDVAKNLPPVPIDGVQMERAIGMLLSNAINLSPLGGSVTVAAKLNGNELALAFTDSGAGLSQEEIPLLFDKRAKLRRPGGDINTVGLYLAHEIVARHRGRIDVQSDPMEGTTLTIFLRR